ncbi:hypothetical protein ACIQUV_00915 [Streptomyces globosus]|uniref:hypothetical protein n=1 Tax=Streptomyces globosus TaxID=68209 RepID=UPI00381C0457
MTTGAQPQAHDPQHVAIGFAVAAEPSSPERPPPITPSSASDTAAPFRDLAAHFAELRAQVDALDKTPGPGFFAEVTPLLLESQQLTRRLVAALSHLSTSDYSTVPGSRSTLDSLAATVGSAALVSTHLAQAIAVNPLDGLSLLGAPADEVAIRQVRETDARDAVEECLAEALHDLDLTATCSYAASGIARNVGLAQARHAAAQAERQATGRT